MEAVIWEKGVDASNYKGVFLDAFYTPYSKDFITVKSYEHFVDFIKINGIPEIVSINHDLSDEHSWDYYEKVRWTPYVDEAKLELAYDEYEKLCGYHAAQFLIEYSNKTGEKINKVYVHDDDNPAGAHNIMMLMNSHFLKLPRKADCIIKKDI